ncbi:MAG: amino acid permease [Alphaproteobacteria bacterium]|nr:MAG: amino acid permease [Alphaproteobacteria bacterium]
MANSTGLMMSFAGIATASTVALAFAGYLQQFISFSPIIIALSLLVIFTIINILGIKESSWLNVIFTLIEVSGLIIFMYFGIQSPKFGDAVLTSPSLATISGSALIIFAYFGFENMVNFVEETKDPKKTLPRAILLSVGVSTVLYVLVALSAVTLLPVSELAQSKAPLSDALRPISAKIAGALAGIALFATANTVLISLVTTSRILYGMGRDHAIPSVFSSILKKRQTPWFSAVIALVLSSALLPLNKVEVLASISSFATMIAFLMVHITLVVLRFRDPIHERQFRVPLSIKKVPILPIIGGIATVFLLLQFDKMIYIIGGGFLSIIFVSQLLIKTNTFKNNLR